MHYLSLLIGVAALAGSAPLMAQAAVDGAVAQPVEEKVADGSALADGDFQQMTPSDRHCENIEQSNSDGQAQTGQKYTQIRRKIVRKGPNGELVSQSSTADCPNKTKEVVYEHRSKIVPTNKRSTVMISCGKRLSVEEKIAMLEKTRNHMATKDFADWEGLPGSGAQEKADVMASIDAQMAEYKAQLKNADQAATPQNQIK